MWVIFVLDPDPDSEFRYGSTDLIESGSETLRESFLQWMRYFWPALGSSDCECELLTFPGFMAASADKVESEWTAEEAMLIKVHQKIDLVVGCAFILKRIKLTSTCYFL